MKKKLLLLISPILLVGFLLIFTSSDFLKVPGGKFTTATFVGSEACQNCHSSKYNDWVESGHPYKFTIIENNQPPVYPPEAVNFQDTWMPNLADGSHGWEDIAGVIGGYGWKARFVGTDGHLIGTAGSSFPTAGMGHNQINFYGGENHGWVDYHPGDEKIYNYGCFKCHTTGGELEGTWLPGVEGLGTFTEGGVGCEGCHGPGSDHIVAPSSSNIDKVYEYAHHDNSLGGLEIDGVVQTPNANGDDINFLCGTCHNRDYKNQINASGGFVKHHEQWDEFVATSHYGASAFEGDGCVTCHDPHKRVIWDGDGIKTTCGGCHADQVTTLNHSIGVNCLDCHMPFAAKSGAKRGESGFKGDVRSHLFKIIPDTANMFTADGSWVRDDAGRGAALSPAYSCLGCHNDDPNDDIPDKTLEEAAADAIGMHSATYITQYENDMELSVYPNPSRGLTNITFTLINTEEVRVTVFNISGQLVYEEVNLYNTGTHTIKWNGLSNTGTSIESGYYIVNISAGSVNSVQKLIMTN